MRTTTRFAMILLCIASVHCGSNTSDETTKEPITGMTGGEDGGASTSGATGGGTTGGSTGASTGGTSGAATGGTTGPAMPPAITGMEPECVAAFTRLAECYLTQPKCTATAKDNATTIGPLAAQANCASWAMMAGGLPSLAMQLNATTACTAAPIMGAFPSLDMNKQLKGLCEAAPLTTAECVTSCENIVPCKADLPAAGNVMMALGDKAGCEGNCAMPTFASAFRCGIMAGKTCSAVAACFAP